MPGQPERNADARATKGLGCVTLFALLLSGVVWWPLLSAYPRTQTHDGPQSHKMIEVIRVSVLRYHELPLWNPFECGGVALWDNPQGLPFAPMTWLTLLVGTTRTIEAWYVVHSAIGVVCMWAFARAELRLSVPASLVAAVSWGFAGVFNNHFTGGHVMWVAFLYFPLALLWWRRAEHDLRYAIGVGLIAALAIAEGGAYPLPYLAAFLGTETLLRVWPPKRLVPVARAGAVVALVALSVGAARFLPLFDQLSHHHRDIPPDTDAMTWANLKDVFLVREHARTAEGQQYVWPEFGDYLGPLVFGLSFLGLLMVTRAELWLVVMFVFALLLQCGHFKPWAPWSVLNTYVFPFKQMRVPSRFVAITTLFLSVFAGFAVDRIPQRLRSLGFRFARGDVFRGAVLALALIGVGDELSIGETWEVQAFLGAPQDLKTTPKERIFAVPQWTTSYLDAPRLQTMDLGCWEEWSFEHDAPLWTGDVPQARIASGGARIFSVDRTPNSFTVDLSAKQPTRVLLNSTYDRGWRTTVGETVEANKMLAVDLPAGDYAVRVYYWPHGLTLGLIVSALSSLVLGALFVRNRRRRSATFAQ